MPAEASDLADYFGMFIFAIPQNAGVRKDIIIHQSILLL